MTTETLDEEPYGVAASVEDAAGNTATASQVLVVDVTTPVVTINGGPTRSTERQLALDLRDDGREGRQHRGAGRG